MSEPQVYPVYFDSESVDEEKLKQIRKYFQIQRKSGGGDCGHITSFSGQVYKVDFKDRQAQQRVLAKREHNLDVGGSSLVLTVRDSPGSTAAASPTSSSAPRAKHEPLRQRFSSSSSLTSGGEEHEVNVDPYLLRYLTDCAQARDELHKALQSLHSTANLYPEKETALVCSLVSFDDAGAAKTWKTEVENVFEEFKKLYVCHFECEAELRLLLLKSCSTCQEEDDVKVYSESDLAVVVGTPSKVQARLKHAENSHVKVRGASLGQMQTRKRRFDKAKFRLLQNEIEQSLVKDAPNLLMTEAEEGQLVFEGTVEEIRKAYDIIEEKEKMVKESPVCDISKHFLTFLMKAYSTGQRLSDFLGCGESVSIEFKPTKIKMFSLSALEIEETEKLLNQKFKEEKMVVPNCSEVPIELQTSLKSMEKKMNEKEHKVYTDFTNNTIILIGHTQEVKQLHGVVTEYILDQSNIEDRVVVPFPELAQKLPELLLLNGFDFAGVKFNPLQSGVVALEGPSSAVSQVRGRIGSFLQSLVRESLIVDMPGALRYFKTPNGLEKLLDVASSHKCLVQFEDATTASEREEVVARYFLKHGVQVIVYLGDITKQEADALVNAANEDLKHGGGVALALSKAGGPEVQKESSDLVKSTGKIGTGEVVVTSGGKLKCKKLLHAVGPEKHNAGGRERQLLEQTVEEALVLAESMELWSLALPCISSGIFGVPIDVCAEAIVSAVRAFSVVEGRSLTKITLIDNRREVVQSFKAQCERMLRGEAVGDTEGAGSLLSTPGAAAGGSGDSVRVEIVQGTIESQQADCLVCPMLGHQPTSTRLGLALESMAHGALQTKFNQSSGGATLPGGTVLVEGVPGLLSKAVVFLNLIPYSSQKQEQAKLVLRQSIGSALVTCESRGFSSMTFPVTGPGGVLQFPHNMAALVLLQEIQAFEQRRAAKTPFQIRIVIHPNDKEASKAFQAAQQNVHLKGFTNDANPNHASFYRHVLSAANEVTALMGRVKLQVVQGDIIHEKTDVIVNSTGFKSEPAGVSKAILTAAGPNVQAELRRAGDPADHVCSTGAGLLGCKEIIHAQTDREPQAINKTCKKVLKLCESKGHTSVAFPAINTGIGNMNYGTAGKAMLDGMASAVSELNPKSLSVIRIVILQQPVFNAFKAELENRFGQVAPPQNLKGKLKNIFSKAKSTRSAANIPPTKAQPAIFSAIGPSSGAIAALKKALEGLVQQQLEVREFELQDLCRLDEMEVAAVQAKARSLGVSLDHSVQRNTSAAQSESKNQVNSGEKVVIFRGLKDDVLMVAELVNKAIKKALSDDLQERKEEQLAQTVQWMYLKDGDDWENFTLRQNYALEKAHEQKEVFVKMEIKGKKVNVNLKASDVTDCTTGETYRVKRCVVDTDIELPGHWKPMAGENFKKVELVPNSKEYQDIAQGFHKTAKCKIHKIERVQNHHLWCSYFVMRRKMVTKNGEAELGEKYLYHGTSAESCHCIEKDRFDRSYTGKHGARFGTGVYFAVNADYSAQPCYSKPDPAGLKRMYVARVLTGRHTLGDHGMKAPPQRGDDPSDKYDSLVDSLQNPNMFVIFHDDQAYPEYLITFS